MFLQGYSGTLQAINATVPTQQPCCSKAIHTPSNPQTKQLPASPRTQAQGSLVSYPGPTILNHNSHHNNDHNKNHAANSY